MMRVIFVLLLILTACAHSRNNKTTTPEHPIVSQCMIMDAQGRLRWSYPAWLCLFLPDGRFITGGEDGLSLRGRNLEVLWHKQLRPHHMMSFAANGDILTLTSEYQSIAKWRSKFKGVVDFDMRDQSLKVRPISTAIARKDFRIDKIVRLNTAGEIVRELSLLDVEKYPMPWLVHVLVKDNIFLDHESSHLNSIYEIPANASKLPAFRPGNVIINDTLNNLIFITDPDLKKILWQLEYKKFGYSSLHDVSVLANGNLLVFKNKTKLSPRVSAGPSSLEEIDPVAEKVVWRYQSHPPENFNAERMGSVQALDGGRFLFAHTTNGNHIAEMINRSGEVLWTLNLNPHTDVDMQGAYSQPVEEFLASNHQHQVFRDYAELEFTPRTAKSQALKVRKYPTLTELEVRKELANQSATLSKYLAKQIDPYRGEATVTSACSIPGVDQNQIEESANEIRLKFLLVASLHHAIDCYGQGGDRQFNLRTFLYCKKSRAFFEINDYLPMSGTPPKDNLAQCAN